MVLFAEIVLPAISESKLSGVLRTHGFPAEPSPVLSVPSGLIQYSPAITGMASTQQMFNVQISFLIFPFIHFPGACECNALECVHASFGCPLIPNLLRCRQ